MAKYNEKYFGKNSEVCAVENMLSAGEQIILREKAQTQRIYIGAGFKNDAFRPFVDCFRRRFHRTDDWL